MRFRKPWDEALTSELRLKIWERRKNPDGFQHKVSTFRRGATRVNHYPFSKMLVGDFFIVTIKGSRNSMLTAFRQGAARNDIEISIHEWDNDGKPSFRVTKVMENIKAIKAKASRLRGMDIPASDGRWLDRRRLSRRPAAPSPRAAPPPPATTPAPPVYDRAEALRRAQAAAMAELEEDVS